MSVTERLVCQSGVTCYLWHGSLLPSPACLVYFYCLCSRSPLRASLEEFNCCGASASPFAPLHVLRVVEIRGLDLH